MEALNRKLLEDTLSHSFEINQFKKFIKQLFNEIDLKPGSKSTAIWREYSDQVNSFFEIASYTDNNKSNIVVLVVELKKNHTVQKARSMQRNFVAKFLEKNEYEGALVAFYFEGERDWRLSFVRLDYTLTKAGVLRELTPAKRYSYLVGDGEPNHTAKSQLLGIFYSDINPTLDELEEAFSIEKVTKEFFEKYKEQYLRLKEYLDGNLVFTAESSKRKFTSEEFAKKLMGQIAFLYFLQKKGWLGVRIIPREMDENDFRKIHQDKLGQEKELLDRCFIRVSKDMRKLNFRELTELTIEEGDFLAGCFRGTKFEESWGNGTKTFIRYLFRTCNKNPERNFFNDYLEPLFYSALNKKRGINQYFNRFNCKIPFLDGGLFEPLDDYDWENTNFEIPNDIFSNRLSEKDEGTGILDIFDTYNFTINEDEPLEKEVAVDPEMLGKIFENLLDVKDRKSKGAFYTPREIVHYMCQESLINYLCNDTGIGYEHIKTFIRYGEFIKDEDNSRGAGRGDKEYTLDKIILENIEAIDESLANIKIADPAVGSGAFPLGMLNEIVKARMNITEYLVKGKNYEEQHKIRLSRTPYWLKCKTMQKSIFAVDIESSAVDITKLRLWLSLIVDENVDSIRPLPNLDYNVMCGNSLVDEFEGMQLFDRSLLKGRKIRNVKQLSFEQSTEEILLEDLYFWQQKLFNEQEQEKKKQIKSMVEKKEWQLIEYKLKKDGNENSLKSIEAHKADKSKPYFLWELEFNKIFQEKGGFDIVIGNPPYIGEKGNKEIFHQIKVTQFGKKYYQRHMDYFYFFIALGVNLLKKNGYLCFITTNYWVTASGAQKYLRPFLKNNTNIIRYINFGEYKIFDSAMGQHNCIFLLEKNTGDKNKKALVTEISDFGIAVNYTLDNILANSNNLEGIKEYYSQEQKLLYDSKTHNINFLDMQIFSLCDKVKSNSNFILDELCTVSGGISSSADKVTNGNIKHCSEKEIIRNDIKLADGILLLDENELESLGLGEEELKHIKPLFKSSEIVKYATNIKAKNFLIYTDHNNANEIMKCKKIFGHLKRYKTILENRSQDIELENAMSKGYWFVLTNGRSKINFTREKIVCPYRAKGNIFGFNDVSWYAGRDVYFLVDFNEDVKFLLGVLNSNVIKFWLKYKGKRKGDIYEIYPEPLKNIPIATKGRELKQKIIAKVNEILNTISNDFTYPSDTQKSKRVANIEGDINNYVYNLYGLNNEEASILESLI